MTELKKIIKDESIIYDNEKCRLVFSRTRPPDYNTHYINLTVIDKDVKDNHSLVIVQWNEDKFKELLRDLGYTI